MVSPARGTWKTRAVGSSCLVGAAKPYTAVAVTATSILAGSPERASAAYIPAREPAPHARAFPRVNKQAPGFPGHEPAREHGTSVAARVELAYGEGLVLDPARRKGALDQLDHFLL